MKNKRSDNSNIIILGGLAPMPFELEKSLIKIVKKVAKFNYEKGKISAIDGLSYLCLELKQMENFNQPQLLSLLTELQQYLKYHIDRRPSDDHPYFLKFKRAINEVEEVLLLFRYHEKTTKKNIKTQYDLLTYLIFDEKNLSYIDYIFTHFPYTVNLENNKTLFEQVLEAYLKEVTSEKQENPHLQIVLRLMLKTPTLYVKEETRNRLSLLLTEIISTGKVDDLRLIKKIFTLFQQNKKHVSLQKTAKEYHINVDFPSRLLGLTDQYDPSLKDTRKNTRVKLKEELITIDKEGTFQFDDALSCKKLENNNYLVGIHIANVIGIIPFSSFIIQEAISRVSTIYLPNQKMIHMLPPRIGMEYSALKQGEDHLANSYFFELSPKGEIVSQNFQKTIICVNKNMTDEEVNHILCEQRITNPYYDTLTSLYEVAGILSKIYPIGRVYQLVKNTEPDYTDLKMDDHTIAGKIVMSTMLLANNQIAEYFSKHDYPLLKRINHLSSKKDQNQLVELLKKAEGEKNAIYNPFLEEAFNSYYFSSYGLSGRHDGLNLEHYCHATSPIRRGSDLIVEECLDRCYFKTPTDEDVYQLEDLIKEKAQILNEGQQKMNDFVKTYQLKLLKHLSIGE